MRRFRFAFLVVCLLAVRTHASAAEYLVGALVYASDASGANAGAYSGTPYQFSTNSSTSHDSLIVDGQGSAISFLLSQGANTFAFSADVSAFPISTIGLELFFNSTGTSYNPAYSPGVGIPGDLAAFVAAGSSAFSVPAAGTDVQSYNSSGTAVNSAFFSGAKTFVVDGSEISITSFTAASTPSGSFTLTVQPVPEPGPACQLTFAGVCCAFCFIRRSMRQPRPNAHA